MTRLANHVICKHCRRSFRSITWHHLRQEHGYVGERPVADYKQRFRLKFVVCSGTRKRMKTRMEKLWAKRGHHWTRGRMIGEIRRKHRSGESITTTGLPSRLLNAGIRLFGSWKAAVERAGFCYDDLLLLRKWSREKVIAEIQELAGKGVPLDPTTIKRSNPSLFAAAVDRFPTSWRKALRAAGLNPDDHKKRRGKWDRENAVDWVKKRLQNDHSILARDTPAELRKFVAYHLKTCWTDFIEALGICYPGKRRRTWSRAKVVSEIRRYHGERQSLSARAMRGVDDALLRQARRFFKTWSAARAAAGR